MRSVAMRSNGGRMQSSGALKAEPAGVPCSLGQVLRAYPVVEAADVAPHHPCSVIAVDLKQQLPIGRLLEQFLCARAGAVLPAHAVARQLAFDAHVALDRIWI